tara:strand:- start:26 stop:247 length:222 start_codon:yes stop_codon:yes gene_type:complete
VVKVVEVLEAAKVLQMEVQVLAEFPRKWPVTGMVLVVLAPMVPAHREVPDRAPIQPVVPEEMVETAVEQQDFV